MEKFKEAVERKLDEIVNQFEEAIKDGCSQNGFMMIAQSEAIVLWNHCIERGLTEKETYDLFCKTAPDWLIP